jgi:hypothetical protein
LYGTDALEGTGLFRPDAFNVRGDPTVGRDAQRNVLGFETTLCCKARLSMAEARRVVRIKGVPVFPGNRHLNCDTGFQRGTPVLAIFHLQADGFAGMNAPRAGRRPVSR